MKTRFKTLAALLLLALIALIAAPNPALAIDEEYQVTTLLSGGTNNVAGQTTNTITGVSFNCTQHDQVGLQVQFKGDGAGLTGNIGFQLAFGANSSTNISTTGPGIQTFLVPANGTTEVVLLTNMTVGTFGYFKLNKTWSTNAANVNATNLVIRAFVKPIREGYRK